MASRHRFLTTAISENPTSPFYTPASASNRDSDHRITVNIIIAGVSVACAVLFLVLTYYAILIRRHRGEDLSSAGHNGASDIEEGLGDYAALRIRTVGLHESVISSITSKPYVAGIDAAADCSVCLSGFRESDMVRLLPSCGHRFHVHCIDPWLRDNISCPLCRADVLVQSVFERSVGSVDVEVNAQTSDLRVSEAVEGDALVAVTDTAIDCIESSADRDRRDLPGNLRPQELRLNSTLLSLGSDLSFRADQEERSEDGGDLNREKRSLRLMQQCLQKNPVFGRCSTSNNVRFLFFSRFGRSSSSPILPR